MLYGPDGSRVRAIRSRPEPNVALEERIRPQLQALDSLLDIKWMPMAVYNPKHRDFEGRYALICNWPQGDKRWALYQTGEIEEHFDMLGWFCTDMHDPESVPVSPDSIDQKVFDLLYRCDAERLPHLTRMAQTVEKNAKLRKSRRDGIMDQVEEVAGSLFDISGRVDEHKLEGIMREIAEGKNE